MIAYLFGKLKLKTPSSAIVEVNGIGYLLNISFQTFERLPEIESDVKLNTILIPREDSLNLYAFGEENEKKMFELLLSVTGIGPKLALNILSGIKSEDLKKLVINGNIAGLTNIPGVGKKTAERILVEIRDKLNKLSENIPFAVTSDEDDITLQAFQALVTLGYQRQVAEKTIKTVLSELPAEKKSVEEILKRSLRILNN